MNPQNTVLVGMVLAYFIALCGVLLYVYWRDTRAYRGVSVVENFGELLTDEEWDPLAAFREGPATVPMVNERSYNQPLSDDPSDVGHWHEYAISRCRFGCKVYRHDDGRLVLGHNSAYGCDR